LFENPELINEYEIPNLGKKIKNKLLANFEKWNPQTAREILLSLGIGVISSADEQYPEFLKQIYHPPPVLFYRGKTELLNRTSVAIVGTRRADNFGIDFARSLAEKLSKFGICIVSGLAAGIDAAAHGGALDAGLTVGVLGTGVDCHYPNRNRKLQQKMAGDALIVSEYPPGTGPERGHFPARNRIISGLSRAVIVVQAGARSGALITADFALEQGREVYAVPGSVGSSLHRGCHGLIKQGAGLVSGVEDVVDYLQLSGNFTPEENIVELSPPAFRLLEFISERPVSLDELMAKSALEIGECSCALLELQEKRLILDLACQRYQRSPDCRHSKIKTKENP
jgi:DNA processing protein